MQPDGTPLNPHTTRRWERTGRGAPRGEGGARSRVGPGLGAAETSEGAAGGAARRLRPGRHSVRAPSPRPRRALLPGGPFRAAAPAPPPRLPGRRPAPPARTEGGPRPSGLGPGGSDATKAPNVTPCPASPRPPRTGTSVSPAPGAPARGPWTWPRAAVWGHGLACLEPGRHATSEGREPGLAASGRPASGSFRGWRPAQARRLPRCRGR